MSIDEVLHAQLDRIDARVTQVMTERTRALRLLKEIEDFASDEVDGAPDSKDPLKHVLAIVQSYANGDIPLATLHGPCKTAHLAAIRRACKAEEKVRELTELLRQAEAKLDELRDQRSPHHGE